jgi:sterol desaturase/sphingolipid hydroxylase (fatty acid hydroxylase superfamily)|tara:strand:+ start:248 stop:679 length:432 start_codon:yes stop_codon:yes gene_type:complete
MIGFVLGFLYGSLLEYVIHRYIFHKLGHKKQSMWSYHIKGHHVLSRKNNFIDLTESKVENLGMILLVLAHIPIVLLSFGFWLGVTVYAISFKIMHGYQHANPDFTKKYMKWHWDHHMKTPNKNFGVVVPWMDYLFQTRKKYED